MTARGLIVAAPSSGAGKTTVTLGLLAALRRRGIKVRAAKAGPDYIDPAFHRAACGYPSANIDTWAMPPELIHAIVAEVAADADLLIIESAMGLFDGVRGPPGRTGAAADLAALLGLPVLLVLDVAGQSVSAAAVAHGFATFDPDVRVAAVVLNRVGSDRHRDQASDALRTIAMPVAGALPRDASIVLPERHLGLVQAQEHPDLTRQLARLADLVEAHVDLDLILGLAAPIAGNGARAAALRPPGQCVAVAEDAAFSFLYEHLAAGWRSLGAEVVPFSPLADQAPPDRCDACWMPGGYPELHAARLAAATAFCDGLRRFAATRPVHGECGGYMVLGRAIRDMTGVRHEMVGLLSHTTSFAARKRHLGYREARVLADGPLGRAGTVVRGHEFRYASVSDPGTDAPLVDLRDGIGNDLGQAGGRRANVTGSFFHAIAAV